MRERQSLERVRAERYQAAEETDFKAEYDALNPAQHHPAPARTPCELGPTKQKKQTAALNRKTKLAEATASVFEAYGNLSIK